MLIDLSLQQYADVLASCAPTPGGGSALAHIALNAISLMQMSGNVTLAKQLKQQLTIPQQLTVALEKLAIMHQTALELIDQDARCFDNILACMRLPKTTDHETSCRNSALQQSYIDSAKSCIQLTDCCAQCYIVADAIIEHSDKFVVSDAHIGKSILKAVAIANKHNISVNTESIKDEIIRRTLSQQAEGIMSQIL